MASIEGLRRMGWSPIDDGSRVGKFAIEREKQKTANVEGGFGLLKSISGFAKATRENRDQAELSLMDQTVKQLEEEHAAIGAEAKIDPTVFQDLQLPEGEYFRAQQLLDEYKMLQAQSAANKIVPSEKRKRMKSITNELAGILPKADGTRRGATDDAATLAKNAPEPSIDQQLFDRRRQRIDTKKLTAKEDSLLSKKQEKASSYLNSTFAVNSMEDLKEKSRILQAILDSNDPFKTLDAETKATSLSIKMPKGGSEKEALKTPTREKAIKSTIGNLDADSIKKLADTPLKSDDAKNIGWDAIKGTSIGRAFVPKYKEKKKIGFVSDLIKAESIKTYDAFVAELKLGVANGVLKEKDVKLMELSYEDYIANLRAEARDRDFQDYITAKMEGR